MTDSLPPGPGRKQVEDAFHALLERLRDDPAASRSFLEGQPEALRAELERMLADYRLLLDAFSGSSGSLRRGRRLGEHELLAEIGRGGMGSVWEAEHHGLQRRVALKLLHPHLSLSPRALERFRREALAGARLSHPGIVAIYEAGEHEGSAYLAMELVPGGFTLGDRIAEWRESPRTGREHWREVTQLFQAVADALSYAHQFGVVHRDLKPGNILISEEGRPRIADFGLARLQDELAISRTGEMTGTPYYMSPEQAGGRAADAGPKADVFALGATLYEALTLQRPFDAESAPLVLQKILREDPRDPREIRSDVPRDLAAIALKALEKKPASRYADAREMGEDLRRYLADEPVLAQPPGAASRVARWVRRHPVWASVVALAAVATLGFAFLLARIVREERITARLLDLSSQSVELLDPRGAAGGKRERVKKFQQDVEALLPELEDRPESYVNVLTQLGRVLYVNRSQDERAVLERALALAERTPEISLAQLTTLRYLCGSAEVRAFKLRAARRMLTLALSGALQAASFDDPSPREIQTQLILALARGNRWKDVDELAHSYGDPYVWMEQRWEKLRRERGDSDPDALETGSALARLQYEQQTVGGGNQRASEIYAQLEDAARSRYGPSDAVTLEIRLMHLAARHRAQNVGDCTRNEMIGLQSEIESTLGADHPLAALASWRVAVLALDSGDYADALPASLVAVQRAQAAFGPDSIDTYNARCTLGMAWTFLGYYPEAIDELSRLTKSMTDDSEVGPNHDAILIALRALVTALCWSGCEAEAVQVAEVVVQRRRARHDRDPQELRYDLSQLALHRVHSGNRESLRPLLAEFLGDLGPGLGVERTGRELGPGERWILQEAYWIAELSEDAPLASRLGAELMSLAPPDLDKPCHDLDHARGWIARRRGEDSLAEYYMTECARNGCANCGRELARESGAHGNVQGKRAWLLLGIAASGACCRQVEALESEFR